VLIFDDTIFTATYDARTRRLTKTEGTSTKMFRYGNSKGSGVFDLFW